MPTLKVNVDTKEAHRNIERLKKSLHGLMDLDSRSTKKFRFAVLLWIGFVFMAIRDYDTLWQNAALFVVVWWFAALFSGWPKVLRRDRTGSPDYERSFVHSQPPPQTSPPVNASEVDER